MTKGRSRGTNASYPISLQVRPCCCARLNGRLRLVRCLAGRRPQRFVAVVYGTYGGVGRKGADHVCIRRPGSSKCEKVCVRFDSDSHTNRSDPKSRAGASKSFRHSSASLRPSRLWRLDQRRSLSKHEWPERAEHFQQCSECPRRLPCLLWSSGWMRLRSCGHETVDRYCRDNKTPKDMKFSSSCISTDI